MSEYNVNQQQTFMDSLIGGIRDIDLPVVLQLRIGDNKEECVELLRICRLLPGKRIVCEGKWNQQKIALKLFVASEGGLRHMRREMAAEKALREASIASPAIVNTVESSCGKLQGLMYQWIDNASEVATLWKAMDEPKRHALFIKVIESVRQMHQAGMLQDDIHLGNFMSKDNGEGLYVLDLGEIKQLEQKKPVGIKHTLENFAYLLAQLEIGEQQKAMAWLDAYVLAQGWPCQDIAEKITPLVRRAWHERLSDYLKKSNRECRLNSFRQNFWIKTVVRRTEMSREMDAMLKNLDAALEAGQRLKSGNTATVAKIDVAGKAVIIKRYNLKNWRHAIARMLRRTRAEISWRNAHILELAGIPAARPVALIEERYGFLRRKAFFLCDALMGEDFLAVGNHRGLTNRELNNLTALLEAMKIARITHGDFKATNFLLHDEEFRLIDLDSMRIHSNQRTFVKAYKKDLNRLYRNWPEDSVICKQLKPVIDSLRND